ncbi:putative oleosin [Rosa chinensis]|uniref:Putative oleosin n=1 Tax=Rosa chinensis TaxID=74649 RepID=A0A2P6Q0B6_ROSCH|nr:oleosin Ara h 15.0101-like [Rosa chinensis]PRQ27579.1 putative oleosin [Rosa chinensis]
MESYQKPEDYSALSSGEISSTVKFLCWTAIGITLYFFSGFTLTGTLMALIVVTPAVVLFSPIMVPAGIFVLLVGAGFVSSVVGATWGLSLLFEYASKKKNWTQFLFDLGRRLVRKYLQMRFGWIGWLWSLWEWVKWFM